MPSIVSHAVVGLTAASVGAAKGMPARFWVLSAVCAMLPDADTLTFKLGIPYAHLLGHRGFFHSLLFALVVGIVTTVVFFGEERPFSPGQLRFAGYFSLVTASHGVLDALTSGGLGVAFFSPFKENRYFFPWTPILVSPLGIKAFFSSWGARVMASEIVWIWAPCLITVVMKRLLRGT